MSSRVPTLRALLVLLGVGGAQVLEMDKSAGTEIDFKYALIGMALGVAISAGFLALKICVIRRHLSDSDSADLKNTPQDPMLQKTRNPRKRSPRSGWQKRPHGWYLASAWTAGILLCHSRRGPMVLTPATELLTSAHCAASR
ncbi:transmembrane protein 273 isoform X1 [Alexandromys fortis]|uniref:transmembrane protein 273 isoform X1 n=1 Tax=Alexandromys fortis TaxID=100897 RepID=UPI002152427E|nr:transmembrane protein 273 isoform X1 [Microtus fortis]